MLAISVLGPVTVVLDGHVRTIPAGKTSELLIRLALEAGDVVRTDRLIEELWADAAEATRRNTLQAKVAKLRRALGDPSAVLYRDDGYVLDVARPQVDACALLDAVRTARELYESGEDERCAARGAEVLAGSGPDVLTVAGDGAWVAPYRARLELARRDLLESCGAARLRMGAYVEIIAELGRFLTDHPYDEALWVQYITAMYRSGRTRDALAAYRRVWTEFGEELGLEPGPQLRQLERQILDHDPALGDPAPGSGSVGELDRTGNVPSLGAELIGRAAEVARIRVLVERNRLVEIVGPGGVGKTALVVEVARRLSAPGGVWLIRLEAVSNLAEAIDATITALGVTGGEAALRERLRVAPTVLILDNCEHVLDEAASWATRLLDQSPLVRILCTSQAAFGLAGSAVVALEPLGLDDAALLFTRRATAQRARQPGDPDAVRELCRSLDGLPLAIELAAARTRTLSLAEITRRLDDRFAVLSDPTSRQPERRRALRATIGWSYDLLFSDDQRGLWALATFAGGASLDAVEAVLAALGVPAPAALDVVSRLQSRSLLIVEPSHPDQPPRYGLLDSIRAFALDAMEVAGLTATARAAHARWLADAARSSTDGVRSAAQAEHLSFARVERSNIDAALSWCTAHDPPTALAIAIGFGWAWVVLGDNRGALRLRAALAVAGVGATVPERATALLLIGWIEASTGDLEPARRHVVEAAGLAEAIDDDELRARSAYYLAYVESHHGHFVEGLALTEQSRALLEGLHRPWDQAANALFAARAAISAGDVPASRSAVERVQRWLGVVEDPWLRVRGEAALGEMARLELRFDDAVDHLRGAAESSRALGFRQTEAYQLASLGRAQCQAGDDDAGAATLGRAIEQAEDIGDLRMAALARVHLGRVLRGLGRIGQARRALEHAARWHHEAGGGEQALLGETLLAALDAADAIDRADALDALDAVVAARARLEALLAQATGTGDAPTEVFALDALARTEAALGPTVVAAPVVASPVVAGLLAQADRRMRAASHFISERDRVDAHAVRAGR